MRDTWNRRRWRRLLEKKGFPSLPFPTRPLFPPVPHALSPTSILSHPSLSLFQEAGENNLIVFLPPTLNATYTSPHAHAEGEKGGREVFCIPTKRRFSVCILGPWDPTLIIMTMNEDEKPPPLPFFLTVRAWMKLGFR